MPPPPTFPASSSPALVTGGTGFLGLRLVERLHASGRPVTVLARHPIPALARKGVRFVAADLGDAEAVRQACRGVSTVFHVAAKVGVWGRFDDYFRANVLGTRSIIEGCREHGVSRLVYTSTPSVVYNGSDLVGADESLPLTDRCPSAYPLTKAIAEREVLAANCPSLLTVALRPHLIWGVGDPHLVPRLLAQARSGRLRIVGSGKNRVDMVHVDNAADAQILAESALAPSSAAAGRAYFITNGEPVVLWDWINRLLDSLGIPLVTRKVPLPLAVAVGVACEGLWRLLPLRGEPPLTRFVAKELATDHWFDIAAARRDLGYAPRVSMKAGTAELLAHLKSHSAGR